MTTLDPVAIAKRCTQAVDCDEFTEQLAGDAVALLAEVERQAQRITELEAHLTSARKTAEYYYARKLVAELDRDEVREALERFVDDEPCQLDHEGYCQAHGVSKPCRVAEALLALRGGGGENPEL